MTMIITEIITIFTLYNIVEIICTSIEYIAEHLKVFFQ